MPWIIVLLGYLLGSTPTAYIARHLLKGKDIRQMGDGNRKLSMPASFVSLTSVLVQYL